MQAKIKNISGRELATLGKLHMPVMKEVTVRYRQELIPQPGADLVMQFEGRLFNIRMISDWEERKQWHILHVEEGVTQ